MEYLHASNKKITIMITWALHVILGGYTLFKAMLFFQYCSWLKAALLERYEEEVLERI